MTIKISTPRHGMVSFNKLLGPKSCPELSNLNWIFVIAKGK